MPKGFPFTKRAIEALSPYDPDSPSREAEYTDAECIGLKPDFFELTGDFICLSRKANGGIFWLKKRTGERN